MAQRPTTTLVFPSVLQEARKVIESIIRDVKQQGYDQRLVFAIRLALDEALQNAIQHGNRGDPGKRVVVEYSVTGRDFRTSITDEGPGFAPDQLPDPTARDNLEKLSGRGVMLMKAYMSRVDFNKRGNRVTLIKMRHCPLPRVPKREGKGHGSIVSHTATAGSGHAGKIEV